MGCKPGTGVAQLSVSIQSTSMDDALTVVPNHCVIGHALYRLRHPERYPPNAVKAHCLSSLRSGRYLNLGSAVHRK